MVTEHHLQCGDIVRLRSYGRMYLRPTLPQAGYLGVVERVTRTRAYVRWSDTETRKYHGRFTPMPRDQQDEVSLMSPKVLHVEGNLGRPW